MRVYFKDSVGTSGFLDITDQMYTVPFVCQAVGGGEMTVNDNTTVYLQPNQFASFEGALKVNGQEIVTNHLAGGLFVSESITCDVGPIFSIGQYAVKVIQFRYFSPDAYTTFCNGRAFETDARCVYNTSSGLVTIPQLNPATLTEYTNPSATLAIQDQTNYKMWPWWSWFILGALGVILIALLILAGAYAFGYFGEKKEVMTIPEYQASVNG